MGRIKRMVKIGFEANGSLVVDCFRAWSGYTTWSHSLNTYRQVVCTEWPGQASIFSKLLPRL